LPILKRAKRAVGRVAGGKSIPNLVRTRTANTYRFGDDGETPNNAHFPLVHYLSPIRLATHRDPAGAFEELFASNGWKDSWQDGIYDFLHFHTHSHEVLGIVRGTGCVQFGGLRGRPLHANAGDVIILPAGTGHQRLSASEDFLVVGAYPEGSAYDELRPRQRNHDRLLGDIEAVPPPKTDPVYGANGPLRQLWVRSN